MLNLNAHKMHRIMNKLQRIEASIEREGADDPKTVEEDLEDVAVRMGMQLDVIRITDADTLLQLLGMGGAGKLWAGAEVLFLDGLQAHSEGRRMDAADRFQKARMLFDRLDPDLDLPDDTPSPESRLQEIERLSAGNS